VSARGRFEGAFVLEQIPARGWWDVAERHWVRGEGLAYRDRMGRYWVVPHGFDTDLASIPRNILFVLVLFGVVIMGLSWSSYLWLGLLFLMWAFPRSGMYNRAAVLHDWVYWELVRSGVMRRRQADDLFYEALRACRVDRVRAWVMWAAVRVFGGLHIWLTSQWERLMGGVSEESHNSHLGSGFGSDGNHGRHGSNGRYGKDDGGVP
jgi:hypothetical protein